MRRVANAKELLDGSLDVATLRGNLRDLARVNRRLGGAELSWRAIKPFLNASRMTTLLDVGTGAGDIPREILRRAANDFALNVVATDISAEIVDFARAAGMPGPALEVRLDAAERLAIDDASFDIVHSSMVLHHLEPAAAAALLAEMKRVAVGAVVVNDLTRGRLWWLGAWLLAHAVTRNRYTRHDAPLSVSRAYRPDEISRMARSVGLREVARHWTRPPYRYALAFVKEADRGG